MAHQRGKWWYPDYHNVGHRKLLLDPRKTPMENLWWLIDVCCAIWLARSKVWATTKESIEELEQQYRLNTFLRFRNHVWQGKYHHEYSIYINVRSAAWGCLSQTIQAWKTRTIDIPNKLVDIDMRLESPNGRHGENCETLADTLASHKVTKLRTKYDTICDCQRKCKGRKELEEVERGERGYGPVWYAVTESEWDYYLQSCDEFGLEPISKEEFLQKNFPPSKRTARERQFAKAKWQSDYRSKQKEQG